MGPAEKLIAVQHKNCKDFWVITILQSGKDGQTIGGVKSGLGIFRIFLVDHTGVSHINDISINLNIDEYGYLKVSPDGKWLAIANGRSGQILVYPFNNNSGAIAISSLKTITTTETLYGVEFSPNSKVLYFGNLASGTNIGNLYQVDFIASAIPNLIETFPNVNGWYAIGALQLGQDGQIYIAKPRETFLAAITNPNTIGSGVNVDKNHIDLSPNTSGLGLPNMLPNSSCDDCECSCTGCNKDAKQQNDELIQRATSKYFTDPSTLNGLTCSSNPFPTNCKNQSIPNKTTIEPCFYFHWGDGSTDQIEEHDTEVFYISVCNNFDDILFKGLKITQVTLTPNLQISSAHIVPDRLINIDCLEPCSCQTREFAIITRDTTICR